MDWEMQWNPSIYGADKGPWTSLPLHTILKFEVAIKWWLLECLEAISSVLRTVGYNFRQDFFKNKQTRKVIVQIALSFVSDIFADQEAMSWCKQGM